MVSETSASCNQSISSTHISLDRIFHNGLLDTACHKLLEYHCHSKGKPTLQLDSSARTCLVDYTIDITKNLCEPSLPQSVSDVCDRLDYSFPSKLRPPDPLLEEIRTSIEKGKKKTLYLPTDKIISCFKSACPRIDQPVALFLTHLIEHTLSTIILWAVNFESKIHSGVIEGTDIHYVYTLFGTPKVPKFSVCQSLPFLHRQSADYMGHAKELQFFLRATVEHLGVVVRVFGDPLVDEMTQLALAAESTFTGVTSGCEIAIAAGNLLNAVNAAQLVFSRASELYSHMTLLSECVDDVFEGQTRLLGCCLIEPAEDETFHSFAYYSEALFNCDCRNWASLLTQTPCMIRALNITFQSIFRAVMEKASSRRLIDLETRYADPHSCSLCASNNVSELGPFYSNGTSTGTSYSNSSHLADSPQSAASSLARTHLSGQPTQSSVADPPGSIPVPFSSTNRHMSRCPASPSCHSLGTFRQPRTGSIIHPLTNTASNTTTSLQRCKKSWTGRRSMSGSPSPPQPHVLSIPGSGETAEYPTVKHSAFLDIKESEVGMSTSSSSSSALNEGGVKSNQGSGAHSYEQRGFADIDEHSTSSTSSTKDMQARLLELFPPNIYSGNTTASCSHMVIAFRYLLPQLLQLPTLQLLYLLEIIEALYSHATEENERSMLKDVLSMLSKTRVCIQNSMSTQDWVKSVAPRLANFLKTSLSGSVLSAEAKSKLDDLIQSTARNQSSSSSQPPILVSEFIMDGLVQIRSDGARSRRSDRIAYLFNKWLLLCKKQRNVLGAVVASATSGSTAGLRVKKRIPLEQFHLIDLGTELTDNGDVLFLFELEYWDIPRRPSINATAQSASLNPASTPAGTSMASADHQSTVSSSRGANGTSPPSNSSQIGSMLSISTLTSSNTLVGGVGAAGTALGSTTEPEGSFLGAGHLIPTAGAAVAAANAALLGALSASPKQHITFVFTSQEDKADWMAALVYLQLSRLFKRYLRYLPRQEIPLVLPSPSVYQFAAPDSITNIIFEPVTHDSSVEIPVIRAATKAKLIERMTYHAYFDSKTVNVFLMTYRRYLTALELLELLIERFNVPEPDFAKAAESACSIGEAENPMTVAVRLEKRFRSVYKRRVQYRVLNFLIKWVKNTPFYKLDIQNNQAVRKRLSEFLDSVDARNLADNVTNIRKSLRGDRVRLIQTLQQLPPEQLDLGLVSRPEDVKLTNVHPLELARQITLYEWELYSRIEFWEVNGKEKIKAPNLQASVKFSNKIKWWLVHSIMTAEHLEDRLVVMQRIADLMLLFEQLNNLQGAQEAKAALLSSPVFRLYHTYDTLITKSKPHHRTLFETLRRSIEADDGDAYMEDYEKKLHEVNPPGLPFIAVGGKTQLIHLELKHPDWITVANSSVNQPSTAECSSTSGDESSPSTVRLINFWKCHQIADLVEYYLSFQQTPYNFVINENIRLFLQTFDPLKTAGVGDEHAFDDLMHEKSLRIQPKPPGEPIVVTERRLSPLEQRMASILSSSAPDCHLTTDSKEFRNLMHHVSLASAASSTLQTGSSENATAMARLSLASEVTEGGSRQQNQAMDHLCTLRTQSLGTNSLGRGRPRVDGLKTRGHTPQSYLSDRLQPSTINCSSHCCHHPAPRVARSASSSPAPTSSSSLRFASNLFPTTAAHPTTSCSCISSPPPLPPRLTRYATLDRQPEQFVNQLSPIGTLGAPTNNFNPSRDSPLSPTDPSTCSSSIGHETAPQSKDFALSHPRFTSLDASTVNRVAPPNLPPRPPRRKAGTSTVSSAVDLLGPHARRATTSVSPTIAMGSNSASNSSPALRGDESHAGENFRFCSSPPSLPPRIHPRQTPSSLTACAPMLNLAATIVSNTDGGESAGLNRSSPPPLPPKRQPSRGAAYFTES